MPFPAFFLLAAALGAREGIINRRDRNAMLDMEAERQSAINNIDLGIDEMGGSNQFDAVQMEAMQRQFQTAQGMLLSQDPKLQSIGANMLQDLDSAVRGNIQQNETEARADIVRQQDQEIAAAGLGKADEEKRFERELTMNRQLNTDLKPFREARLAYDKIDNLLDTGDRLSSIAGLTSFIQSIDKSIVREGELRRYQSANGMVQQLVDIVNASEGRDFTVATKQSIRNAAAAIMNAEKSRAIAVTNSYQDRAIGFALDPDRVLSGVDENLFTPIQIDRAAQDAAQNESDAAEAAFAKNPEQFKEVRQGGIARAGAVTIAVAEEIARETGIWIRGSKLIQRDNGDLFEKTKEGKLVRIEEAEILRASREAQRKTEDERLRRKNETGAGQLFRETPTQPIIRE